MLSMNKIYNAIMGLVVGDALGVPVEFKKRDTYEITDMIGYGTYNQPPGTWSDDSSMTLATLESIARIGCVNAMDIMKNFENWLYNGEFTPYGVTFDVGGTTQAAISRFNRGCPLKDCGGKSINDNGNGALMRILPISLIPYSDIKRYNISSVTRLTHAHDISITASFIYTAVVEAILNGQPKEKAVEINVEDFRSQITYLTVLRDYKPLFDIKTLSRDDIKSSGYVVDTLEAALWCLYHTDNYRDCVLTAVNLGEDTDTVAAVTGGLAGLYYGCGSEKGIPLEWIEKIPRKEWITQLCNDFNKNICSKGSN